MLDNKHEVSLLSGEHKGRHNIDKIFAKCKIASFLIVRSIKRLEHGSQDKCKGKSLWQL